MKPKRQIVHIDEDKCNGCGDCAPQCAEGAIKIVNGKAKLIGDALCDGLGACLGHCPQDAIRIEEREAEDFDPVLVEKHLKQMKQTRAPLAAPARPQPAAHVCPGSMVRSLGPKIPAAQPAHTDLASASALGNWPLQLHLVPPQAPWLSGADILLAADCVPFALNGFHGRFLQGKALLIGCPKLDDTDSYVKKLAAIISVAKPKSITVIHMEVPCCLGLANLAQRARELAQSETELKQVVIGIRGNIVSEEAPLTIAGS